MRISWLTILLFCLLAAMMASASSLNTSCPVHFRKGLQDGPTSHFKVNTQQEDGTFPQFALYFEDSEDNEYEQGRKKNNSWPWAGISEDFGLHPVCDHNNHVSVSGLTRTPMPAGQEAYLLFRNLRI